MEYEFFGDMVKAELVPGGSSIPVTSANRQQYVDVYCEWLLTKSIEQQFRAFFQGFHQVGGAKCRAAQRSPCTPRPAAALRVVTHLGLAGKGGRGTAAVARPRSTRLPFPGQL